MTDGVTNASLPRGTAVEEVTVEYALNLLKVRAEAGPSPRASRRRPAKKSAAPKKAAVKKAAKKAVRKKAKRKKAAAKKSPAPAGQEPE